MHRQVKLGTTIKFQIDASNPSYTIQFICELDCMKSDVSPLK